jgi:selenide,water dikinase
MKKLVLVGGGHSHAIVLRQWGLNPLAGVDLILITNVTQTPYSGMLPGYLAGFYSFAETHIDLFALAKFARARIILDSAIALDLTKRQIICKNQPPIDFDYLSLDIGSTPKLDNIAGSEYVIPAKPIPPLLTVWENLLTNMQQHPQQHLKIVIVGGGAGGVELALNMQTRLHSLLKEADQPLDNLSIALIQRAPRLLPDHNAWVSKQLDRVLQRRGINIHYLDSIQAITKTANNGYQLSCQSGLQFSTAVIFWVTQASAAPWLAQSGLQTDERGFVLVAPTLESISHPRIFAAGDVATVRNYPRPKAGVFAVRQGQPLFENLRRSLQGKTLKAYLPQKYYLSLISTGDQNAIATWGNLAGQHPLFWQWKDHIDRAFMAQFQDLKIA